MAKAHREHLKQSFKKVDYMCATSDIWTRSNKSFIAVSVHYFEEFTLKSKFIACEFFPGRHTHDRVAKKLNEIFDRYGISSKVCFITTDGAGEYIAALKHFGDNYTSIRFHENLNWLNSDDDVDDRYKIAGGSGSNFKLNDQNVNGNESSILTSDSDSDSDDEMDRDQFIYNDESALGGIENSESFQIEELPLLLGKLNRIDCAAHKLEKLGKKDALNAKKNDINYSDLYDRAFGKLKEIWNFKESRLSAEIFARITGRKLIGPHRIRWLKECEAVSKLVNIYCHLISFNSEFWIISILFLFLLL